MDDGLGIQDFDKVAHFFCILLLLLLLLLSCLIPRPSEPHLFSLSDRDRPRPLLARRCCKAESLVESTRVKPGLESDFLTHLL